MSLNYSDILSSLEERGIIIDDKTYEKVKKILKIENGIDAFDSDYDLFGDPIEYINQIFTDEESLNRVDDEINKIEKELNKTDKEIEKQLSIICERPDFCVQSVDSTLNNLNSLMNNIQSLSYEVKNSQEIVIGVTKDIQELENAKKNISNTISILNHFEILSNGIVYLRECIKEENLKGFIKILPKLVAVEEIFTEFSEIEKIEQLLSDFNQMKIQIKQIIVNIFKGNCSSVFEDMISIDAQAMSHITFIAERVFDFQSKNNSLSVQLRNTFLDYQFKEYTENFINDEQNNNLEKFDIRFTWLKRILVTYDEIYVLWFPYSWEIDFHVIERFIDLSSKNLRIILDTNTSEIDCKVYMASLQKTINFEDFLNERLNLNQENETNKERGKIWKILSSIFHDYIHIYIEFQDKNLKSLLSNYTNILKNEGFGVLIESSQNNANESEEKILKISETNSNSCKFTPVLSVAGELFLFYKRCLIQFSKMKSLSHLDDMVKIFKKYLNEFLNSILEYPWSKQINKSTIDKKLSAESIKICCCVIATASYCLETIGQLEIKLCEISPPEKNSGDFSFDQIKIKLTEIIARAQGSIVQMLDTSLDPAWTAFSKNSWSSLDSVGDQSSYVSNIAYILSIHIPTIRNFITLKDNYFEKILIKFASFLLSKYIDKIFGIKSITSAGIEQLLLDTQILKKFLLSLPNLELEDRQIYAEYTQYIKNGMKKLEIMLKLVITPHKPFDEFIEKFLSLVEEPTAHNFQQIVEMKSLKKNETNMLIESFNLLNIKSDH